MLTWKGWICSATLKDGCFVDVGKNSPVIIEWAVVDVEDATATECGME